MPFFVESAETMHGFGPHTAVSVSVPALHDLDPDSEYPALQVDEQLDPLASELGQGDATPLVMATVASVHAIAVSQLEPSYPVWHVHVHDPAPAVPSTVPPLMQ